MHKRLVLFATLAFTLPALGQVNVPHTFSANTNISASQMNANFDYLEAAIAGISGGTTTTVSVTPPLSVAGTVSAPTVSLNLSGHFGVNGSNQLELAASAVTSSHLQDNGIMNADINSAAAIAWGKISKSGAVASDLGAVASSEVGTSPNQIVRLDGIARLPPVDGSQLINLPLPPAYSASGPGISIGGNLGVNIAADPYTLVNVDGLLNGTAGTDTGLKIRADVNQSGGAGSTALLVDVTPTALGGGSHRFVDLKSAGATKFAIMQTGDVGIGTATPSAALDVVKTTGGLVQALRLRNATSPSPGVGPAISFQVSSAANTAQIAGLSEGGTNGYLGFFTSNTNALNERMRIVSNGNVGIGTLAPTATLEVAGTTLATAWTNSSDGRLKKNVREIPHALESLRALRGVTYEWIEPNKARPAGRHVGLIAQEVEKVYPDVVYTTANGTKSVSYATLVAPLINAVKELDAENRLLKAYLCRQDPNAPFCP